MAWSLVSPTSQNSLKFGYYFEEHKKIAWDRIQEEEFSVLENTPLPTPSHSRSGGKKWKGISVCKDGLADSVSEEVCAL